MESLSLRGASIKDTVLARGSACTTYTAKGQPQMSLGLQRTRACGSGGRQEETLALMSLATSEPFKWRDNFCQFRGSDPALDHLGNIYQITQEVVQRVQDKSCYPEREICLCLLKNSLKLVVRKITENIFFFTHLFRLFNSVLDSSLHVACIPLLSSDISISLVHVSSSLRNNEDGKTFLKIMIQL